MGDRKLTKRHSDPGIFSRTQPVLILEGNIFDCLITGNFMPNLNEYLYMLLNDRNYKGIVFL
jgi:hypothetical protein